jgi:hypothetical protein
MFGAFETPCTLKLTTGNDEHVTGVCMLDEHCACRAQAPSWCHCFWCPLWPACATSAPQQRSQTQHVHQRHCDIPRLISTQLPQEPQGQPPLRSTSQQQTLQRCPLWPHQQQQQRQQQAM